jgi:hypothetical protein
VIITRRTRYSFEREDVKFLILLKLLFICVCRDKKKVKTHSLLQYVDRLYRRAFTNVWQRTETAILYWWQVACTCVVSCLALALQIKDYSSKYSVCFTSVTGKQCLIFIVVNKIQCVDRREREMFSQMLNLTNALIYQWTLDGGLSFLRRNLLRCVVTWKKNVV